MFASCGTSWQQITSLIISDNIVTTSKLKTVTHLEYDDNYVIADVTFLLDLKHSTKKVVININICTIEVPRMQQFLDIMPCQAEKKFLNITESHAII